MPSSDQALELPLAELAADNHANGAVGGVDRATENGVDRSAPELREVVAVRVEVLRDVSGDLASQFVADLTHSPTSVPSAQKRATALPERPLVGVRP